MSTAGRYARFARLEARGNSPCYEAWCAGIAADPDICALIDTLPEARRQPNLVLAAARWHGAAPTEYATFRAWLVAHWDAVAATARVRATQTNEPGRCATLLPLLAALPQPLALIEAGASAGLCLYPDRYRYRYDAGAILGDGDGPIMDCATSGPVPLPTARPRVVWRAGIDLNPLDVNDEDAMAWLEALVWPEQDARRARLRAAIAIARAEPPHLVRGDIVALLPDLVAAAPAGATVVVFHSAVLAYLPPAGRQAFIARASAPGIHWIANEAAGVVAPSSEEDGRFVLMRDGDPVALAGPHGQSLTWLSKG